MPALCTYVYVHMSVGCISRSGVERSQDLVDNGIFQE